MASELRVNSSTNRSGLGTITYTDSGPIVSGVGTFANGLTVDGTQTTVKSLKLTGDNYNANWFKSTNKLRFNDNAKATFGTADDLSIYHDGSHSILNDSQGSLLLRSNIVQISTPAGSKYFKGQSGVAELYYSDSKKFETTNTGAVVSGILTATTFAGNGDFVDIDVDGHTELDNVNIAGVCTATSFVGSGANLTSLPTQVTIANNADNRVITGGSGVNLNGESLLTYNTSTEKLSITRSSQSNVGLYVYHSDGNEAGHFGTIGSGNEGILALKDGGTDTIILNGESGGDSYFNTGKFTIGGTHGSSSFGFTDGSLDVQGNDTTAFIDLGNPIPSHTNGTLPCLRLKSNCTSKTAEIQKIYGGDNNVYKHIEFNGRHTAIHDCYPGNAEIARFGQNGLTFNGDTAAANALDDYEEGDHDTTVTMSGDTSFSYTSRTLAYTKIGRVVHITGRINMSGAGGSSFRFTLPFTCGDGTFKYETSNEFQNIRFNDGYTFRIRSNTAYADLQSDGSDTGIGVDNPHINVSLTYFVA